VAAAFLALYIDLLLRSALFPFTTLFRSCIRLLAVYVRSNGGSFPRVGRNLPLVFVACFHFQYTPSRNRAQALKSPLLDPRVKFCARTRDPLVARQRPGGGGWWAVVVAIETSTKTKNKRKIVSLKSQRYKTIHLLRYLSLVHNGGNRRYIAVCRASCSLAYRYDTLT